MRLFIQDGASVSLPHRTIANRPRQPDQTMGTATPQPAAAHPASPRRQMGAGTCAGPGHVPAVFGTAAPHLQGGARDPGSRATGEAMAGVPIGPF